MIGRVPAVLHTPLMSATNAIHGIVMLGAMLVAGTADTPLLRGIGILAVVLGAANVFGGFVVTDRMLEMFKKKEPPARCTGERARGIAMSGDPRFTVISLAYIAAALLFVFGLRR